MTSPRDAFNVLPQLAVLSVAIAAVNTQVFASESEGTHTEPARQERLLETVLVTGNQSQAKKVASETQYFLSAEETDLIRGISSEDLIAKLPSANITTNSRGETLVNIRGAGERQLAVFFNGALVNVPWDNRYDLELLPANAISSVATATGTLSPQYGVNALSAVSLQPKTELQNSDNFQIDAQFGSQQQRGVDVVGSIKRHEHDFILGLGSYERDGVSLSNDANLEFHQTDNDVRTNTDYDRQNLFFHYGYEQSTWDISASVIYADIERGIAPESDRPADDVRFWRYPKADTFMAIVSGSAVLNANSEITATAWVQDYQQTINSYTDSSYSIIDAVQEDDDQTQGLRFIYTYDFDLASLNLSGNYLHSEHDQKETDFDPAGFALNPDAPTLKYSQDLISTGLDFEAQLVEGVSLELGAGIDSVHYIDTGELPGIDNFSEPVLRAGIAWQVNDSFTLRGAVGEKSRLPTLRELFGAALNRFLINPDLKPETIVSTEVGFDWHFYQNNISVTLFDQNLDDTIDQRRVDGLRQRINLKGSQVTGIEFNSHWGISDSLSLIAQATITDARRKVSSSEEPDVLSERPENFARLQLDYQFQSDKSLYLEAQHRGKSFSPDPDGDFQELDDATLINLGLDWNLESLTGNNQMSLYLRAENITDEFYLPQSGLPAAGMSYRVGARFQY